MNLSHYPLRAAIGAFTLNAGLSKWGLEGEAAEGVHSMATVVMPPAKQLPPRVLVKALSATEIVLGAALLTPIIPSAVVGAGVAAFGTALLRMYWVTPGMHGDRNPRPTQQGTPLAKDLWLVGAGLTLILDDLIYHRKDIKKRVKKEMKKSRWH